MSRPFRARNAVRYTAAPTAPYLELASSISAGLVTSAHLMEKGGVNHEQKVEEMEVQDDGWVGETVSVDVEDEGG